MIKIPSKLIISGEHSVLYNDTALTCAVEKFISLELRFDDYHYPDNQSLFVRRIVDSFFLHYKIDKLDNIKIIITSEIEQNCGLGSSSSLIIAVLIELYKKFNLAFIEDEFLQLAQKIENFQHGKSSGVDLKTIYNGGICCFNSGVLKKIDDSLFLNKIFLIYTGKSAFCTRDVVDFVANGFQNDKLLWSSFADLTLLIVNSVVSNDIVAFKNLIYENHLLLKNIGIVSEKVCKMIDDLRDINVFAKVCGAGTIGHLDDSCGYVAIFHDICDDDLVNVKKIVQNYDFELSTVGLHFEKLNNNIVSYAD